MSTEQYCVECYAGDPPRTVVATDTFYKDPVCRRHYDQLVKQSGLPSENFKKEAPKKADDPAPKPEPKLCSHHGCDKKLKASNKSGRCTGHFYIPSAEKDEAGKDPAADEEPEENTAAQQKPEPVPDDLPFKMTIYSEDEYAEKFTSARYASPKIMALLKWIERLPFKKFAVIETEESDTPSRLKDRIERTFAKYCIDKPYKLEVSQETKLNHVRIAKLAKGA